MSLAIHSLPCDPLEPSASARMSGRVPTPLDIDPWWDVFLPAVCGDSAPALDAMEVAVRDGGGDVLAVAARACFVLGCGVQARRFLTLALAAGGDEVDRLAVLLGADGRRVAANWLLSRRPAPIRADVACDLAARCFGEGDARGANEAIDTALAMAPEHREAQRWRRFLAFGEEGAAAWRQARRTRPAGAPRTCQRDADALAPLRAGGYLCDERLRRRLYGVAGGLAAARGSTGLGHLAAAGVQTLRFTWSYVYARLPLTDPRVALELLADDVASLVDEGRDPRTAAAALLGAAEGVGGPVVIEAARLVVALASRDERLAALALRLLPRLREADPAERAVWDATEAAISAGLGPHPRSGGIPPALHLRLLGEATRPAGHGTR